MSDLDATWPIHLTAAAEVDFEHAVQWSARQFGPRQARVYSKTLAMAIEALMLGPDATGAKARGGIGKGLMTLHVARHGREGRHFVVFRVRRRAGRDVVEVLRLLHDAMDPSRHVTPD